MSNSDRRIDQLEDALVTIQRNIEINKPNDYMNDYIWNVANQGLSDWQDEQRDDIKEG